MRTLLREAVILLFALLLGWPIEVQRWHRRRA